VHNAAVSASNDRIWRTTTKQIMDGDITPQDLLIVQYTDITRTEFWSSGQCPRAYQKDPADTAAHIPMREKFADGNILRFKNDAHLWATYDNEKKFLEQYLNDFVSVEFELERSRTQNYNFQNMLYAQKIPVIFLHALGYGHEIQNDNYFNFPVVEYTHDMVDKYNHALSSTDAAHINQIGHKWLANHLYQFIQENLKDKL
jgi:hypothetical protein